MSNHRVIRSTHDCDSAFSVSDDRQIFCGTSRDDGGINSSTFDKDCELEHSCSLTQELQNCDDERSDHLETFAMGNKNAYAAYGESITGLASSTFPQIQNLRVSEALNSDSSVSPLSSRSSSVAVTPSSSCGKLSTIPQSRVAMSSTNPLDESVMNEKALINLIIVGHVDAGKSTLIGHLAHILGYVDQRTIHKYKKESARIGKMSFAYAWVLDETEEERQRGITMDIAKICFETEHRRIIVIDAPGHRDFIRNMIYGAAQADVGLLVVDSTLGKFEVGFDIDGQTVEHSTLLKALGVNEIIVAVNKMDVVNWTESRFDEICAALSVFLSKQVGFRSVNFIPVSGLIGSNLNEPLAADLCEWYKGHYLMQIIDQLASPGRAKSGRFRGVINDVRKNLQNQLILGVKIESGFVNVGEKLFIMPNDECATIKSMQLDGCSNRNSNTCFAGDQAVFSLTTLNFVEQDSVMIGHVLCRGGEECIQPGKRYVIRIVVLNIAMPIIKGARFELHAHSLCEPCTIVKLRASLNKVDGRIHKEKPRCLTKHMSGVIEIEFDKPACLEPCPDCKALSRVTLRAADKTIAAGIVEMLLK